MFAVSKDLIGNIFCLAYVLAVRRRSRLGRLRHLVSNKETAEEMAVRMSAQKTVDHNTPRGFATYSFLVDVTTKASYPV